ncbi:MAG: hypothetical protein ABDH16_05590 [Thermodesulfovibrionaceae bacterium]
MIETIRKNISEGVKTFKFWAQFISERLKVEINIVKLAAQINKLVDKRDELLKDIGKEVYENPKVFEENEKIKSLIRQIREIEAEIEEKKSKLKELESLSRWS